MKTLQSGLQAGMLKPRAPVVRVEQSYYDMAQGWIEAYKAKQTSFIENIRSPFDYESAPLEYLIDDLVPLAAITMFSGRSGSGKSTLVMKLADAVSEGKSFMGRSAKYPRPILYLDRENPIAFVKERLTRLRINPGKRFKYWGGHLGVDAPLPGSESIKEWIAKTNPRPVIIVDSLIRFLKGKEDNSEVISAFFEPLRNLTHLGCTVVVLHHTGKSESSQEYRGSSDIEGAIDVGYAVHNADRERLTNMKLKLIKGRVAVASEIAFTYSDGEFIPQELKAAREHNLTQLLRLNPGIIKSEFEKLAMSKQVSRNEVRDFIDTGIGFGTILTRQGERNAKLLYLSESTPRA
jgi:RecA-family ATPase